MAKGKIKALITAFTPEGDYLAILSTDGTVKVWNTISGSQLAEWKDSDENLNSFSCLACCCKGKKHKKEQSTCMVALGTDGGDVSVLNVSNGQIMWKSTACHPGTAHLSFRNDGCRLHAVGTNGMVREMNSETGELTREFKISKKLISSASFVPDDKLVAAVGNKIRVFSLEDGKELLKFSNSGPAKNVSASGDSKFIVASGFVEKHLQVWKCDFISSIANIGPIFSMKHPPLFIECKNGSDGEDSLIVLSISENGVAHLWNLKSASQEVNPTKITVKAGRSETESEKNRRAKKHLPILAAKIHGIATDGQVKVLVASGSVDSPQFTLLNATSPGADIVIASREETAVCTVQNNGVHIENGVPNPKEKAKNKRPASDIEISKGETLPQYADEDPVDGTQLDFDPNEPTMGEKLATLNLTESHESLGNTESSPRMKPPSADSVHVLLKQALHADDQTLLIKCLYRQDEKVIANTVSKLNSSDVLKLLQSLLSIIQSRGAVLVCTLPWLRSLLLQHASGVMSQESSLLALNSLYQLIDSRVSTFNQALQLSSSLDLLYRGNTDEGEEESDAIVPAIYEDKDESETEGDEMDTESNEDEKDPEYLSGVSDFEYMKR